MTEQDKEEIIDQLKARVVMLSEALSRSNANMLMLLNALKITNLSPQQREFIKEAREQLLSSQTAMSKAMDKWN